jgi:Fic family protein
MALAQDEKGHRRFYSLSAQIVRERDRYYEILEHTQRGTGDITEWLLWFLGCFQRAIDHAGQTLHQVLVKAEFWRQHAQTVFNDRQRKVINRLLDAGKEGFTGGLSTKKYASMTKTSRTTAYREISDLVQKQVLQMNQSGGRSTNYDVIWPEL